MHNKHTYWYFNRIFEEHRQNALLIDQMNLDTGIKHYFILFLEWCVKYNSFVNCISKIITSRNWHRNNQPYLWYCIMKTKRGLRQGQDFCRLSLLKGIKAPWGILYNHDQWSTFDNNEYSYFLQLNNSNY